MRPRQTLTGGIGASEKTTRPITRILALDHRQDVPIVMVTGTVECALLADALAAGADDVPYSPSTWRFSSTR